LFNVFYIQKIINKKLKILIPYRTTPAVSSFLTLVMKKIIYELRKKMDVMEIWFMYMPKTATRKVSDEKIILADIHDYKNAKEALEKLKPDLIFTWPTQNFIDFAFSIAGKHLKIPVISGFHRPFAEENLSLKSYISMFFEKTIPTVMYEEEEEESMKRGRFFLSKYFFLLRTQIAIKMTFSEILKDFFILLKLYLVHPTLTMNSRFGNTLHWLSGEDLVVPLVKAGFKKSTLVVTGNPMFDDVFQRISKMKSTNHNDGKTHVLFAPSTISEHGFASYNQQDNAIKEIVKKVSGMENTVLTVKIHPSSAILSRYKKLIESVDPSIEIYQEGDILDFLKNNDVVVTFPDTSVLAYALFLQKPIIIFNFYNAKGSVFIERGIAHECKKSSELASLILKAVTEDLTKRRKVENFIKDYFYRTDGLAANRICEEIVKLVKAR